MKKIKVLITSYNQNTDLVNADKIYRVANNSVGPVYRAQVRRQKRDIRMGRMPAPGMFKFMVI